MSSENTQERLPRPYGQYIFAGSPRSNGSYPRRDYARRYFDSFRLLNEYTFYLSAEHADVLEWTVEDYPHLFTGEIFHSYGQSTVPAHPPLPAILSTHAPAITAARTAASNWAPAPLAPITFGSGRLAAASPFRVPQRRAGMFNERSSGFQTSSTTKAATKDKEWMLRRWVSAEEYVTVTQNRSITAKPGLTYQSEKSVEKKPFHRKMKQRRKDMFWPELVDLNKMRTQNGERLEELPPYTTSPEWQAEATRIAQQYMRKTGLNVGGGMGTGKTPATHPSQSGNVQDDNGESGDDEDDSDVSDDQDDIFESTIPDIA